MEGGMELYAAVLEFWIEKVKGALASESLLRE